MTVDISINPARSAHYDASRELLIEAGLPVADLTLDHFKSFFVASAESAIVGLIGLESFSRTGLLRSLVVEESYRGLGLGRRLVDKLERVAIDLGVAEVWLLTVDADQFFAQLGYSVSDRAAAPDVIAKTPEFVSLCPGGAVLMKKSITVAAR